MHNRHRRDSYRAACDNQTFRNGTKGPASHRNFSCFLQYLPSPPSFPFQTAELSLSPSTPSYNLSLHTFCNDDYLPSWDTTTANNNKPKERLALCPPSLGYPRGGDTFTVCDENPPWLYCRVNPPLA